MYGGYVRDGSEIVVLESSFDNTSGFKKISRQTEAFAKTLADITIKVKTTDRKGPELM
uniref:Uncharacterized protein n=1 Tax=Panagrolaimus sp. PS1159 TaxID=55785 RepID=A0AC35GPG4_9BILA